MILSFAAAWIGAAQQSVVVVRGAVMLGASGFFAATLCFVWLAVQAVSRRGSTRR